MLPSPTIQNWKWIAAFTYGVHLSMWRSMPHHIPKGFLSVRAHFMRNCHVRLGTDRCNTCNLLLLYFYRFNFTLPAADGIHPSLDRCEICSWYLPSVVQKIMKMIKSINGIGTVRRWWRRHHFRFHAQWLKTKAPAFVALQRFMYSYFHALNSRGDPSTNHSIWLRQTERKWFQIFVVDNLSLTSYMMNNCITSRDNGLEYKPTSHLTSIHTFESIISLHLRNKMVLSVDRHKKKFGIEY